MQYKFKIVPDSRESAEELKNMLADPRFNDQFMLRVIITTPEVEAYLDGDKDFIKEFILNVNDA